MDIDIKFLKSKKIHFIGIGGISMSALAQILKREGCYVQGSDLSENDEVKVLKRKHIMVFNEHKRENLFGIDVVVYTSAIHEDNDELKFARENNLIILKRAELLGIIASCYKYVISISGSHGKTTATAMIAEMFEKTNLKPTIHIGGKDNYLKSNYKVGNKKYFITEACEYMDNFLYIKADVAVVLNVDMDHLDYFKNLENLKFSFKKFALNLRDGGIVIANSDDENSIEILKLKNCSTFGINNKANLKAKNIVEYAPCKYSFDAYFCNYKLGNIKLNIFGKHNIYNALVCILIGIIFEIDFCEIVSAIENFSGVERRCEFIGKINEAEVYHDYAHHPKQIEKMISMAKDYTKFSHGKIFTVFEPHTYSRTKFLLNEFVSTLTQSNYLFIVPAYSARENENEGLTSFDLFKNCKQILNTSKYCETLEKVLENLKKEAKEGDIVLVLGAGNIYKFKSLL